MKIMAMKGFIYDKYQKAWERFAGKPYVKPRPSSRKPGEIAGMVKDAQELLRRVEYSKICQWEQENFDSDQNSSYYHLSNEETGETFWSTTPGWATTESKSLGTTYPLANGDVGPWPQSLGELCIELYDQELSHMACRFPTSLFFICTRYIDRRDIQDLRTLMWHTHRDPAKERRTQRLEGIIELVREDLGETPTPVSTREMRFVPGGWTGMTGYGDGLLTPHNPEICGETEGQDCPIHHPPFTNYPHAVCDRCDQHRGSEVLCGKESVPCGCGGTYRLHRGSIEGGAGGPPSITQTMYN